MSNQLSSPSSTENQLNPGRKHTWQMCVQNSVCKPGQLLSLQTTPKDVFVAERSPACGAGDPCRRRGVGLSTASESIFVRRL